MQRRLTAILAADIVGYSTLMSADQERTLTALRKLRSEVFDPTVAGHRGKLVKSMGDGWLVEFTSAIDAVTCGMQMQDRLEGHETIKLRIGVHIGDVVHEEEDIFGDGVNVAARLEALAEPGAVVVSDAVHGALDGTLRPSFDDQGEQHLKNIDRPIRVWTRGGIIAAPIEFGTDRRMTLPHLAIVPVATSDDREEVRELAAALTNDLATYLDVADWLSVSTEEDPAPGRYVLEASLRCRGDRLRLDARLATPDGAPLWAAKFDGTLEGSFDWQDETGEEVAAQSLGRVMDQEKQRLADKTIQEMTAEECYLNGHLSLTLADREASRRTLEHYAAAIDKDPEFSKTYSHAISMFHSSKTMGLNDVIAPYLDKFPRWLEVAETLAKADPELELYVAIATRKPFGDEARLRRAIQNALRQMPFKPDTVMMGGAAYVWMGEPEAALECLAVGRKLNRFTPWAIPHMGMLALASVMAGRDDEAIAIAEEGLHLSAGFGTLHRALASALAHAGRLEEAQTALKKALELVPGESITFGRQRSGYSDTPGTQRYFEGLRLAGMPEGDV
jgi:adenylate cyclase